MNLQTQSDKDLADAARMLVAELQPIVDELQRRGFDVTVQGYYRARGDGTRYEFQVERVTREAL
ncbi:hypothetical protein [Massilia sp.]|uniref:hypothetical protein n=1 Tax=Massilia sp. TaxID=1882437 RepID=UPI00352C5AB2